MGGFAISQIDEIVHGRVRLGIMTYLSATGVTDFSTMRAHLDVTDGNLSTHLRKLEDAGYVKVAKSFIGRRPITHLVLTDVGRTALVAYLDAMRRLVDSSAG